MAANTSWLIDSGPEATQNVNMKYPLFIISVTSMEVVDFPICDILLNCKFDSVRILDGFQKKASGGFEAILIRTCEKVLMEAALVEFLRHLTHRDSKFPPYTFLSIAVIRGKSNDVQSFIFSKADISVLNSAKLSLEFSIY